MERDRGSGHALRWVARVTVLMMALASLRVLAAVDLTSFEATADEDRVHITWETASETDMLGFYLQRAVEEAGEYERISELIWCTGGELSGADYAYGDEDVVAGQTYFYRLEALETGGHVDLHGPISATVPGDMTPTPTATGTPLPTHTPTSGAPGVSTPSPVPATDTPQPTSTPRPTDEPTATATESPTRRPTATPSATRGAATSETLPPPTTVSPTRVPPSLTPSRMPSATPTFDAAPVATDPATETPLPSPTATRGETLTETSPATAVAQRSSPEPTPALATADSSLAPAADAVEAQRPRWFRLAIVLAAAGGGLILLGAWGLLWRKSGW